MVKKKSYSVSLDENLEEEKLSKYIQTLIDRDKGELKSAQNLEKIIQKNDEEDILEGIPVVDPQSGNIISAVSYTDNISRDEKNHRHLGLTVLQSGEFVLVHGTDWQGEEDTAEVIETEEAVSIIYKNRATNLLFEKRFSELAEYAKKKFEGKREEEK